jgi:hypothetical protein
MSLTLRAKTAALAACCRPTLVAGRLLRPGWGAVGRPRLERAYGPYCRLRGTACLSGGRVAGVASAPGWCASQLVGQAVVGEGADGQAASLAWGCTQVGASLQGVGMHAAVKGSVACKPQCQPGNLGIKRYISTS